MSFPTSPVNGQIAVLNNTTFVYNSTQNTWTVVATTPSFANLTVTGTTTTNQLQAGLIGNSGALLQGTLITAAQGNITSVGTLTSLTSTGTIAANQIQAGVLGNSGALLTGTLTTAAQGNITSTGALTSPSFTTSSGGQITGYHTGAIGANTANTGAFTTVTTTGNLYSGGNIIAASGTTSTSTTTGALVVSGGVGITGNLYVGGNLSIAGNTTFINTTTITTTDTIAAPAVNAGTIGNASAVLYGTLNSSSAAQTNITSVGTLTGLTVSGTTNLQGTTNGATINATSLLATTIGNSSSAGTFSTITSSTHTPSSNNAVTLGSASAYWSTCYAVTFTGTSTTAKYADLAEMYHSDDYYTPGTVMIFGGDLDVTVSTRTHDTAVAGVVSTNPAYLMNDNFEHDNWLPIALTGRVPCLVRGPVNKGTLLVSSSERGVACAMDKSLYEPGCIIGKSMDIILDDSIVKIEIAVGRF